MAGETGLEPATYGFGDRRLPIELLPQVTIHYRTRLAKVKGGLDAWKEEGAKANY